MVKALSLAVLLFIALIEQALNVCTPTAIVTSVGGMCSSTQQCAAELSCNSTSSTCNFASHRSKPCLSDSDCNNALNQQPMICVAGTCTNSYKVQGEVCTDKRECAGEVCTGGLCAALSVGSNCTNACGNPTTIYCKNQKCAAFVNVGDRCGELDGQSGGLTVCGPNLQCVNSTFGSTTGLCVARVGAGQATLLYKILVVSVT
jgi:hypothetical protein